MNYDGAFGGRPAPSLAEAMMSAQRGYGNVGTPCTTPNAFSRSSQRRMISTHPSFSQQPVGCRVGFETPMYDNSSDMSDSSDSENEIIFIRKKKSQRIMRKVEREVCNKLEVTLKHHYKMMKSKIKQVQQRVESTDASIERLSKLLDAVTEAACEFTDPQIQISTKKPLTSTQPPASSQRVMMWRRKRPNSEKKNQSQAAIDALFF
jgi:hypothetical protein